MSAESNLDALLKGMKPEMRDGKYVFLTFDQDYSPHIDRNAVMIFREVEGITVIVKEEIARTFSDNNDPVWAMITLTVHSDLKAVGFLAAITAKLAQARISVNPVSAFHHDHLFVLWEKRNEAMKILQSFSKP